MPTVSWFNPVIFQIGPLAIYWYGLMYALTFLLGYLIFHYSKLGQRLEISENQKDNLLFSIILGIILGGRIGYILFYNLQFYLQNPIKIPALWEGGLSFHGGLIGATLAIWIYCRKHKVSFLKIADLAALITPIGILLGRLGNFINGELVGRITDKFCFHFPIDPSNCRYPSQLFEAAGEGLLTFLILYFIHRRHPHLKPGKISSLFLIIYPIFRISIEFFREPDPQIGFLPGGITLGQLLSILMLLAGLTWFWSLHHFHQHREKHHTH